MICLDTSVIVDRFIGKKEIENKLSELDVGYSAQFFILFGFYDR